MAGYVSGSIPYALLLGKAQGIDIREHGSGNVGATNLGRILGKKYGLTCFGLDVLKGLLPVLLAGLLGAGVSDANAGEAGRWMAVAAAAVLGHVFPVWLKFKGGKGVATGLGVLLGFWPVLTVSGLGVFVIWLLVLRWSTYVGLASSVAAGALPILTAACGLAFGVDPGALGVLVGVTAVLGLLVIVRHRGNLKRVWRGEEARTGWLMSPAQRQKYSSEI